MAAALLLCYSYSYSELVQGTTENAIVGDGLTWQPLNVLPAETGLVVNGVVYRYTAVKDPADQFSVTVQNQNALTGGYIFSETDDWSSLPGNTIRKAIPLDNISYELWGTGEIKLNGNGSIENPSIIYSYMYDDRCVVKPVTDPTCPGYVAPDYSLNIPSLSIENYDDYLYHDKSAFEYDDFTPQGEGESSKRAGDRERALGREGRNKLLTAQALEQARLLEQLNNIPNFELYYVAMPGGVYNDVLRYEDKKIPDSKEGRRNNFAQQLLHRQMVESQYNLQQ